MGSRRAARVRLEAVGELCRTGGRVMGWLIYLYGEIGMHRTHHKGTKAQRKIF